MHAVVSPDTLARLVALGADPDLLPEDPKALAGLGSDLVLLRDAHHSARDLSRIVGIDLDLVLEPYRSLGVTIDDPDEIVFTDADVEFVRMTVSSITGPLAPEEGQEILRVAGRGIAALAEAGVAESVQRVEARQLTPEDFVRSNLLMTELALDLGGGLSAVFRHHLRQAVRRQRAGQADVTSREFVRVAVGFVDLVGFTERSRDLAPAELAELVATLELRASDLATAHDVRLVKLIGDEVMFVGLDPRAACAHALEVVAAFSDVRLVPRGGLVHGEVLFRQGDYFGPVVNRASRLADHAVPGEVLVDESLAGVDGVIVEPAGRRMLRGFPDPVAVFSLASAS